MPEGEENLTALCDGDPLARALSRLRPAASGIDPSKLLYEAGRAAAARKLFMWRIAFAAQSIAVIGIVAWIAGSVSSPNATRSSDLTHNPPIPPMTVVVGTPAVETAPRPRPAPIEREQYFPEPSEGFAAHQSRNELTQQEQIERIRKRNQAITAGFEDILPQINNCKDPSEWKRPYNSGVYAAPKREDGSK